jgi:hypothetical protein
VNYDAWAMAWWSWERRAGAASERACGRQGTAGARTDRVGNWARARALILWRVTGSLCSPRRGARALVSFA